MRFSTSLAIAASLAVALLAGCEGGRQYPRPTPDTGGNANQGQKLIVEYRCGSCHTIPGIDHANGVFGPPLNELARRSYIAGNFPNTPDTLIHWVMNPKAMKPKTAMPHLGLSEPQARDVAAYLETLR